MVEANTTSSGKGGSELLKLLAVDKEAASGLFREQELNTHVDIVLANYIAEAERVANVSLPTHHSCPNQLYTLSGRR